MPPQARTPKPFDTSQQWTLAAVADHLGVTLSTVRAYRARGQMPPPDGILGRTPWWWSSTITGWERPGRGWRSTNRQKKN